MDILLGTTNPSKVKRFASFLEGCDVRFYTLEDLGITREPEEKGGSPEENAVIKARFYGQYFDRVICNDSGLYFDGLPRSDPRQPGLHIRTPGGGKRLGDEKMIAYYSALIRSLGGRITAFYLDGIGVYNQGKVYSYMEDMDSIRRDAFYMVDRPSEIRRPGWPLDSLSLNPSTMNYFTEGGNDLYEGEKAAPTVHRQRLIQFLKEALGIPM